MTFLAGFDSVAAWAYLEPFVGHALAAMVAGDAPQVAQLFCGDGYLAPALFNRFPDTHLYGLDPSRDALAVAAARISEGSMFQPLVIEGFPSSLPQASFSHAIAVHPPVAHWQNVLRESARLLAPRGQLIVCSPSGQSFVELFDLLRECALKLDRPALTTSLSGHAIERNVPEHLEQVWPSIGFTYVEATRHKFELSFVDANALFSDPAWLQYILPTVAGSAGITQADPAFRYLRDAIDRYWSDRPFGLTVELACVTARRRQ